MSAPQRTNRSRSKTVPDAGGDYAGFNGTRVSTSDRPPTSDTPAATQRTTPHPSSSENTPQTATKITADMLEALSAQNGPVGLDQINGDAASHRYHYDNQSDNRSSSLSELVDGLDDQDQPTPLADIASVDEENDSEAETERLERTPRKLVRTATNTTIASESIVERTPSKLSHALLFDQEDTGPPSPLAMVEDIIAKDVAEGNTDMDSVSLKLAAVASSTESLLDIAGKKRKRASEESSEDELEAEEPARKRSDNGKDNSLNTEEVSNIDPSEQADLEEEEEDHLEEPAAPKAEQQLDLEETIVNVAEEAVNEMAAVARLPKTRKGRRKGRKPNDSAEEVAAHPEEGGEHAEGDHDEEDGGAMDEELHKKKSAIESLAQIERKFKIFREKYCDESLQQTSKELEMLKQPNCTHPEYLAMVQCLDERRAEKIDYEKRLFTFKTNSLNVRSMAERHQLHGQYFQYVRELRETVLAECNDLIYQLQKGRRQTGVEETTFAFIFPEKKSTQIQHQTAYNHEVSVLSGVAKYVGFPAAPNITPARSTDIDDDLRAMKIPVRPAPAPATFRPTYRASRADEAAAEEQFIEQTPWANPRHPDHQAHYQSIPASISRNVSQTYQTPAAQRRMVDVHAPNGSASTIDMVSNPPSSAAAQGQVGHDRQVQSPADSPVLQMKRNAGRPEVPSAGEYRLNNFAALSREAYQSNNQHLYSSPAGAHTEHAPEDRESSHAASLGGRWSGAGMRHLTAGAPPPGRAQEHIAPSSAPRNDPSRTPLGQRTSLGAVSVGSGSALFGR